MGLVTRPEVVPAVLSCSLHLTTLINRRLQCRGYVIAITIRVFKYNNIQHSILYIMYCNASSHIIPFKGGSIEKFLNWGLIIFRISVNSAMYRFWAIYSYTAEDMACKSSILWDSVWNAHRVTLERHRWKRMNFIHNHYVFFIVLTFQQLPLSSSVYNSTTIVTTAASKSHDILMTFWWNFTACMFLNVTLRMTLTLACYIMYIFAV